MLSLSDSVKISKTSIPWKNIAGMWDKLIHAYFVVDMDILWKAATQEIPMIEPKIQQILQTLDK
ncbi:HepT-like ribonuclease domain-containing protein [Methanolobus bombayensis]|uniref:HepT-like ribonuclease domain-containing protein n=1 Tax=Methanolobus bombayensis TaxID=38023 RepID=UPI001AE2512D|nr:HepT-like ribonuclease domain-containing protein [Methanolobus bombayensis]MBP1910717.1 uncharacterized protein with HEPN domain [Methanolobus bombayensis]